MAKSLTHQIVALARSRIEDKKHWTRGVMARDKHLNACKPWDDKARAWCAVGALIWACSRLGLTGVYLDQAYLVATARVAGQTEGRLELIIVNDERGHSAVM